MSVPFGIPNGGNTCWFAAATQALLSVTRITPPILMETPAFPSSEHAKFYSARINPAQIAKIRDRITTDSDLCAALKGGATAQKCADEYIYNLISSNRRLIALCGVAVRQTTLCTRCETQTASDEMLPFARYYAHLKDAPTPDTFAANVLGSFDEFMAKCDRCAATTTWRRVYVTRNIGRVMMVNFVHSVLQPLHQSFDVPIGGGRRHFTLVAAIIHGGTKDPTQPTGGHYTACVKRGDKWYNTSDSAVSDAAGPPADTANVPLAIYEERA